MQTLYLWGELGAALETARAAEPYLKDSKGMLHSAEHRLYEALISAASLSGTSTLHRRSRLRTLRKNHSLLKKWAAMCPHNFLHKERLVAGELARLAGDTPRAAELYLEGQLAAADSGSIHIAALAHQLAAASLRDRDSAAAATHREAACDLYRRWGAAAYAEAMENGIVAKEIQS
jgi:hypothetical protein